jgi:hypothetical protein
LQISLKEGIRGESEGDFTDSFNDQRAWPRRLPRSNQMRKLEGLEECNLLVLYISWMLTTPWLVSQCVTSNICDQLRSMWDLLIFWTTTRKCKNCLVVQIEDWHSQWRQYTWGQRWKTNQNVTQWQHPRSYTSWCAVCPDGLILALYQKCRCPPLTF